MRDEYGTYIAILAGLVGILLFLLVSAKYLLLGNYNAIETGQAREHLRRVVGAFDGESAALSATTGDYATWDDTCAYLAGSNPAFIADNFAADSLSRLRVDVVAILRRDGTLLHGQLVHGVPPRTAPLPAVLAAACAPETALVRQIVAKGRVNGVIAVGGRPLLVSARPVLDNRGGGEPRGYLVMGRFVEERELVWLAELTRLPLTLVPCDRKLLASPAFYGTLDFSAAHPFHLYQPNRETLEGYALVSDIDGQPAFVFKLVLPRQIYHEGLRTIGYFMLWALVIVSCAAAVSIVLLKRLEGVQRRRRLAETLSRVVASHSPHAILLLDADSARILQVTPVVASLLGIPPGQLEGALFPELICEGQAAFALNRAKVLEHSPGAPCRLALARADRSVVAMTATLSLVYLEQEPLFALLLVPDLATCEQRGDEDGTATMNPPAAEKGTPSA